MAFSSLNGDIDVTFPADVKANVSIRSDRGDVFSDFDVQLQASAPKQEVEDGRGKGGKYRVRIDKNGPRNNQRRADRNINSRISRARFIFAEQAVPSNLAAPAAANSRRIQGALAAVGDHGPNKLQQKGGMRSAAFDDRLPGHVWRKRLSGVARGKTVYARVKTSSSWVLVLGF